jgi:hypothetical protein
MRYRLLLGVKVLESVLLAASPVQATTLAEVRAAQAAKGLFPVNWHILIIPERNWLVVKANTHVSTQAAFTNLKEHETIIRERFVLDTPEELRYVLAHEAGHIACQCKNEVVADSWAHEHE